MSRIEVPHEFVDGKCRWCGITDRELDKLIERDFDLLRKEPNVFRWDIRDETDRRIEAIYYKHLECNARNRVSGLLNQVFYAGEGIDQP